MYLPIEHRARFVLTAICGNDAETVIRFIRNDADDAACTYIKGKDMLLGRSNFFRGSLLDYCPPL